MKTSTILCAFLGGALAGAGAALLFAPAKGEETRDQIKALLKKYGVCKCQKKNQFEELVDEIAAEINEVKK